MYSSLRGMVIVEVIIGIFVIHVLYRIFFGEALNDKDMWH